MGRSNFSFLQGGSHPEEMVETAIELGYHGIALCDLNGLYGVVQGYKTASTPSLFKTSPHAHHDFRYLTGAEVQLIDGIQLVLLPINKSGYMNLCRLITTGKRQATKGHCKLSLTNLQQHSEELLAFMLPPFEHAKYEKLSEIFADRLYLPVWRDLTWDSKIHFQQALCFEKTLNAQLFVTNRPYMHSPERKALFDTLTCILHQTTLSEAQTKILQNSENYLHSLDDLLHLWSDRLDLVANTLKIAQRVQFDLGQLKYQYPQAQLPPNMTSADYLRFLTKQGLQWRYPQGAPCKILEMAEHELNLIVELEYEDYFLTLHEICEFAKQQKILFQGRGSAANSIVCFALGLTSVDPTKIDLLFERFISKERNEPPDIDIDFEHQRREEVIQYIYKKYDPQHAAMICTVIRYKSRMAIRETAKVFGVKLNTINQIIKHMGRDGLRRLKEDFIWEKFNISPQDWKLILAVAQGLYGFPRHVGIHTGGFLITQNHIDELVPVEAATMNGRYVIQWNKDDVNFMGLMKIDLLSLGMLSAIRKCFDLLKKHKNLDFDLFTLPQEDPKTYEMISKADTVGVFQIESRAQMQTLPRMKPSHFYDLVVEVALIRPGPLQGGMVHPYLRRRQGLEKIDYGHPKLEAVLKKTLGVPIFQEQVMKIVMSAASFTPGEADELRRLMAAAWRGKGTMEGVRHRVMNGFKENGIPEVYAKKIFQTIEGFANYGFPESHAASFALLSYASSFLKCHHPEVFLCALLNSQPMGFYSVRTLIADAQRHGVCILPLDIETSEAEYTIEKMPHGKLSVRTGLNSIYGLAQRHVSQLLLARQHENHFKNLSDFIQKTQLPKSALIKLAAAGAMGSFGVSPRNLIWQIEATELDQNSFLWGFQRENLYEESFSPPGESDWQSLQREYSAKGFVIDNHPMRLIRDSSLKSLSSKDLFRLPDKKKLSIAGLLAFTQKPPTAKGFCFMTLEDEFGLINVIVPPKVYEQHRLLIYSHCLLKVTGIIQKKSNVINIKAENLASIF